MFISWSSLFSHNDEMTCPRFFAYLLSDSIYLASYLVVRIQI